jgi:hypothetical protein
LHTASAAVRADLRVAQAEQILKFVPTGAKLSQVSDVPAHSSSFPAREIPTSAQRIFTTDREPSAVLRQYLVAAPRTGWNLASIDCSQSLGTSTLTFVKIVPDYLLELEAKVIRYEGNIVHATVFPSRGVSPSRIPPVTPGVLRTDPGCLVKAPTSLAIGKPDPAWPASRVCASVASVWPDAVARPNRFGDRCLVTFRGGTTLSLHATRNGRNYALSERVSTAGDDMLFATGARDVGRASGFWIRVGGTELEAGVTLPDTGLPERVLLVYARDLRRRFTSI